MIPIFFSFNYACVYCREHCVNVSCWLWHGRVKAPSASVPWEWQSLPVVQVWMLIVWAENVYVQLAFTAPRLHTYRDCFYWEYLNLPHCPSVGDILPPCPLVCNSPCLCSAVHNSLGFQDVIAFLYKPLWVCVSAFFFFFPVCFFFFFLNFLSTCSKGLKEFCNIFFWKYVCAKCKNKNKQTKNPPATKGKHVSELTIAVTKYLM